MIFFLLVIGSLVNIIATIVLFDYVFLLPFGITTEALIKDTKKVYGGKGSHYESNIEFRATDGKIYEESVSFIFNIFKPNNTLRLHYKENKPTKNICYFDIVNIIIAFIIGVAFSVPFIVSHYQ